MPVLRAPLAQAAVAAALAAAAFAALASRSQDQASMAFMALVGLALLGATAYLVWHAEPAWTLSIGLVLVCFSGYWDEMGIPSVVAPDRIVLAGGLAAIMLRAPGSRDRPALRFHPIHWLLLIATAYALCSAVASGTLLNIANAAALVERFGVIPFLIFLCAPVAFRTERQREVLLKTLVALGAYLGFTALMEALGIDALVFPRYILDPNVGILAQRARGPFADPVGLGVALFACSGACLIAIARWRSSSARLAAAVIALLCAVGLLFTLTRQVWLASVLGLIVAALVVPALRARLIPLLVIGAVLVAGSLALVPGLSGTAQSRTTQQRSLWDRYNVNEAALRAIEARPLLGVGWEAWLQKGPQYLRQADDYPLTAASSRIPIHNGFLSYLAQLGLIGGSLWVAGLFFGAGFAVARRAGPGLEAWRALGLGVFVFVLVVLTFTPGQGFSNVIVWLLAGLVVAPHHRGNGPLTESSQPSLVRDATG